MFIWLMAVIFTVSGEFFRSQRWGASSGVEILLHRWLDNPGFVEIVLFNVIELHIIAAVLLVADRPFRWQWRRRHEQVRRERLP